MNSRLSGRFHIFGSFGFLGLLQYERGPASRSGLVETGKRSLGGEWTVMQGGVEERPAGRGEEQKAKWSAGRLVWRGGGAREETVQLIVR